MSAVTDALKTIKLAENMKKPIHGVIITRYQGTKLEMDIPTIKDMLEVPVLGIVPEDKSIKESQKVKNAVIYTHPKSKASEAYRKIARHILGPEALKQQAQEAQGFFRTLLRKLGF